MDATCRIANCTSGINLMDDIARQSQEARAELFQQAAAQMGVRPIVIEKDFWVCWTLKRVFNLEGFQTGFIFKGGTSLSKAYGAIQRFSEDIDISLDRHDLGFTAERDPASDELSGNKRKALLKELTETSALVIQTDLRNRIIASMSERLPNTPIDLTVSKKDPHTLIFNYPLGVPLPNQDDYLQDKVKLEFGARSDHVPAELRQIKSYAAEIFPDEFSDSNVEVKCLSAVRTFWEKATILHMLHHAPSDKALGKHMSRHYYDLVMLADTEIRDEALDKIDLLSEVARHKTRFFRDPKAKYEEAEPSTLRLMPTVNLERLLRSDYLSMKEEMIFGEPPKFDAILANLSDLEKAINGLTT